MSSDLSFSEVDLPPEIDHRRERFEQHWDAPSVARIVREVADVSTEWKKKYLRELLYIEFEFARIREKPFNLADYLKAFSEDTTIVVSVATAVGAYNVFQRPTDPSATGSEHADEFPNVDAYTLIEEIGRGGMGIVYRAKHNLLNQEVAIKVVNKDFARDQRAIDRFMTEIQSMGRISHPNIVKATDAGTTVEGAPYLVMELIDGINLVQWLQQHGGEISSKEGKKRQRTQLVRACELVRDAAWGVQAIHDAELVHRDIKPENLMLLGDGTLKILDLGLAKLRSRPLDGQEPGEPRTRQGHLLGTPGFMAPEQLFSPADVDIRADIYSLGSTLFFLLFGRSPVERYLENAPTRLPKRLRSILDRSLAADPAARYRQPSDLAKDLDAFLKTTTSVRSFGWLGVGGVLALLGLVMVLSLFSFPPRRNVDFSEKEAFSKRVPEQRTIALEPNGTRPTATPVAVEATPEETERQATEDFAAAVEKRFQGDIDQARDRLAKLEERLREKAALHGTDSMQKLLALTLSASGDCDFFSGLASESLSSKKWDRLEKLYKEALELSDKTDPGLKDELNCKLTILSRCRSGRPEKTEPFEPERPLSTGNEKSSSGNEKSSDRQTSLFGQLTEAIRVFETTDRPLRSFVEQFELSSEPELFSRNAREIRLFALEFLIHRDRRTGSSDLLNEDLRWLDGVLFSVFQEPDANVYLRRYFDLAILCCPPDDLPRLAKYLLRLRPQRMSGARSATAEGATYVLFYFNPNRDVNGFAIYYPHDRQRARRFECMQTRNQIKEAVEHDISLPLDKDLVALILADRDQGIPIVLSWDDTACWPPLPRRDAFRNEDWPFETSISLKEILGQMK